VRAQPLADALAFANRAAALSCRALDGRSAIPTLEEVA
jgi:sulfofructose kinase